MLRELEITGVYILFSNIYKYINTYLAIIINTRSQIDLSRKDFDLIIGIFKMTIIIIII
jgi:hypothetical protein